MEYLMTVTLGVDFTAIRKPGEPFSAHRTACNNWGLLFCWSFVERLKIKLALLLIYSEMISACRFFNQKTLNIRKMLSERSSDPIKIPH